GSVCSPRLVEPTTSANSTVTVLRTSACGGATAREAPQLLQKRDPSGFSWPQFGHRIIANSLLCAPAGYCPSGAGNPVDRNLDSVWRPNGQRIGECARRQRGCP